MRKYFDKLRKFSYGLLDQIQKWSLRILNKNKIFWWIQGVFDKMQTLSDNIRKFLTKLTSFGQNQKVFKNLVLLGKYQMHLIIIKDFSTKLDSFRQKP